MNRSCLFILFFSVLYAQDTSVVTRIQPRSLSRYRLIQIMNDQEYLYHEKLKTTPVVVGIIPQYMCSTDAHALTQSFFGPILPSASCTDTQSFLIQGSNTISRDPRALLADYFYLPPDYVGKITVNPSIQNTLLNFDFYCGLDYYIEGLYIRLYGPFVHTRWDLHLHEQNNNPQASNPPGYFTPGQLTANNLLPSFESYARGQAPQPTYGDLSVAVPPITPSPNSFPIFFEPLQAARLTADPLTRNGFADLRGEIGWNLYKCDNAYCSLNIQGAAPTGTNYSPCTLFSPQISNHLWELGAGLVACYRVYQTSCNDAFIDIAGDINVTHFFKKSEWRIFDLIDKPLSRYMLALQFTSPIVDNLKGGGITPSSQFNNRMAPLANITTEKVIVGIDLQADLVIYTHCVWRNFSSHIGYNYWGRTCEKISKDTHCTGRLAVEKWALKGDARIFGFIENSNEAVALSATESNATIFSGTNQSPALDSSNTNIDGPLPATGGTSDSPLTINPSLSPQINTSIDAVLLTPALVHYDNGTSGSSHTIFAALHYTHPCDEWTPFIGVGGFFEWGNTTPIIPPENSNDTLTTYNCTAQHRTSCISFALTQWSVFAQCGFSYRN